MTILSPESRTTALPARARNSRARDHVSAWALTAVPFVAHLYLQGPCPMRLATGCECAGCGGTRAVEALLHGDAIAALDFNALVLVVPLLIGAMLASRELWPRLRVWRVDSFYLLLAVLTGWTLLRNLPGFEMLQAAA